MLRRFVLASLVLAAGPLADPTIAQVPTIVPGFPNVAQTPGAILSGLNAPGQGRTAIIAYHNGILYTLPELPSSQPGSDFQVRTWDLSDPTAPVETAQLGVSPMPINAHGYFKSGDYLIAGANWPPEAPWSFRYDTPGSNVRTEYPDLLCAGTRGCLFGPFFVGQTWWSYGEIEGTATFQRDWVESANWDHLGDTGVIGHPFLLGDLLIFASDQSRTGVATYDVSDSSNPVLLDVLTTGGAGGYWPDLWSGDGKLYIVFPYRTGGNGMRVVDATDPSDLQFVADVPLPGDESMYVQFQDEYAFLGSHKVDMRTFESVLDLDGANTTRPSDGGTGINTSQFLLPIGNLLVTGGIGPNQGMAIWAHQATPDTRGPTVTYHRPLAGQSSYPVDAPLSFLIHETLETPTIVNGTTFVVRPIDGPNAGQAVVGELTFAFNDILTFAPDADLESDRTYEVVFPAGGIRDAANNGMVGYSFTFSTGSTVGGNAPPVVTALTASAYPVTPGQNLTLNATANDPDAARGAAAALDYRFDFGDGSAKTAWSTTASAIHAYASAGHYQATVQVRDAAGSIASRTTTVTALVPPAGPRPTHSTPITCDATARRVIAVNPDNDSITAVHADSLARLYEVTVCDDPRSAALSSSGELWVTCHDDDTIRVVHPATGAPIATLDLGYGSAPSGLAFDPSGTTAYVALQHRGELRRFDAATRVQTGSVAVGPWPRAVAVSGDGSRVYATRFLSPRHHGEVYEVDATTFTSVDTLKIGKFGNDANRDGTASGRGIANYLAGLALSPDGSTAWVASNKPNMERGLLFDEDLDTDNTVRNVASALDLGTGALASAIDIDNSDSAAAVSYSPLGDYLFVALQGNDEILVLDALRLASASGLGALVTRLGVGAAPQGLCADPTTNRLFVQDFMDRTVTVLEADDLFRTGTKQITSSTVAKVTSEALSASVRNGKRLFYHASDPRMSAEGYMSCATCHIDGGTDGRTWDFTGRGEGLRNTTTLRGRGGTEHGNVHWTANFDEIQDFENDIRGAFGGSGFLSDGEFAATSNTLGPMKAGLSTDLDDLAAYVESLGRETVPRSPFRQSNGSWTAQALAGRTVFAAEGCTSCHGGAGIPDSSLGTPTLHDVGTLRTTSGQRLGQALDGIDSPTLAGVWATAPYFHDGSAETLDDVFRAGGGAVIQAETAALSNGASVGGQYVNLNNDSTPHGLDFVDLGSPSATLTLSNVDGGPGGVGDLEIRYSNSGANSVEVRVNAVSRIVALPSAGNDPSWRHTHWNAIRVDGVTFTADATNTVQLVGVQPWPNVTIDDVTITTATERAAAEPHRRVLDLSTADRDALIAYLQQLDATPDSVFGDILFYDGFELGNTSAWGS